MVRSKYVHWHIFKNNFRVSVHLPRHMYCVSTIYILIFDTQYVWYVVNMYTGTYLKIILEYQYIYHVAYVLCINYLHFNSQYCDI